MKYVVYGKEACQSCKDAVALLTSKGREFEYKSFGKDYDFSKFGQINKAHKGFPMITVIEKYDGVEMHEQYVGGLYQLQQILNSDSK